ncbi:MAG: hypothetical protein COA53_10425 [Rhodobacteraceae bacterium]|nr:MAG: hypothetical protein COA53_10425 [Paracoccaceae bacterium]
MNGFIRKYRWIFVIVAGGLAIGIALFNQQDTSPVAMIEEAADSAVESVETTETEAVAQQPSDAVVVDEEHPAENVTTQEGGVETETESPPSEPDPVEVVEEDLVDNESATTMAETDTGGETPSETTTQDQPADANTSEAAAVIEEVTGAITTSDAEETTGATKPSFDVVRVDPTGAAIIAGTAEPFSKVVIRSNGEDIGEAIAGSTGEFVAMTQMPDTEQGQTLKLEAEVNGELLFSDDSILILPILQSNAADAIGEESAPPIVRATDEEIVVLQGGAQLALGELSLDSISYDENDEVVLAGRGSPGRTIIIYVDNAPLTDTVVSNSGSWKQALLGLDAGRYVLRVDEVDDDGTVTSRVESPFQREYPEDLREAKALSDATYTVQPGNSLWLIATGRYGDGLRYHQIFSANKDQIRNPDLIYPGQVLAIPDAQE